MKQIAQMMNFPSSCTKGLDSLVVEKIDMFRTTNTISIVVSHLDMISEENNLVSFVETLSSKTSCKINIKFIGVNSSNLASAITSLQPYIAYCLKDIKYFNECSLSYVSDDTGSKVVVSCGTVCYELMDESGRKNINTALDSFMQNVLCINPVPVEFYINDADDDYVYPDPAEAAPAYPAEDDYYSYQPVIPQEIYDSMREAEAKAVEKQAQKEKSEDKEELDPESWLAKAKKQQAENKKENSGFDYRNVQKNADSLFGRVKAGVASYNIKDVTDGMGLINIAGQLTFTDDLKLSKTGNCVIAKFNIIDKTGGIAGIMFVKPEQADEFGSKFKKGGYAGFQGIPQINRGEFNFKVDGIFEAKKPSGRKDYADYKRVELHVHSKMSEKDAVSEPSDIMKLAASFGHRACAITDHGNVQAFPDAYNTACGLKVGDTEEQFKSILGCEGYLVDDGPTIVYNLPYDEEKRRSIGSFVSITIETTGKDSCTDTILKVAASKYRLKNYLGVREEEEGESDEDAIAFSKNDIDTSLWEPEEIPEKLRDENIAIESKGIVDNSVHVLNIEQQVESIYSEDGVEVIPDTIVFEHVADFYAEVEDIIYPGSGEPCDSYFRMGELVKFIGDSYITGPNIFETLGFLRRAGFGINIEDHVYYRNKFLQPAICLEDVVRYGYEDYKGKDVLTVVSEMGIKQDESGDEPLLADCKNAAAILAKYLADKAEVNPTKLNKAIGHLSEDQIKSKQCKAYHVIYLARNNLGLYNMYNIVSEANIHYFYFRPRTPKSMLKYFSSSMIVGGACERGEIYRHVMSTYKACGKSREVAFGTLCADEKMADIMSLYDYVEIQPICNNIFMTREDPQKSDTGNVPVNREDIVIINELLVQLADYYGKPCCATTDSHFLEKDDGRYRKLLLFDMGFADADQQSDLYFRTTDEMLDEFSYLGEDKAFEVVVTNTNKIADMIEYGIKPFPSGTYPPIISRAAADVRDMTYTKANRMYRHNGKLNEEIAARIEKELNSIIGNGYAIMYYIAYRLVKKSNNDGYIVGSRGSVGSSLVATMCGITEVNPMAPHYRCPKCKYCEFDHTGTYGSGFDMPLKNCPECGEEMIRDGQEIPFETFLGFYGDKQPDIDLNFSSAYQPRAHEYVAVLFGASHTFRAGTIGAFADKNAIALARKVAESKGQVASNAMLAYMSDGIIGVKRTTGQHPGGIVVVPKEMDVYEFTPIQYPANKTTCGIITTHFDFNKLHDTILKLDILGHADPTVLRMLQELTDIQVTDVPVPDVQVMSLLESTNALGFPLEATEAGSATLGLSEMGTHMARNMIKEAKPTKFYDLVQLMGLSHGTDVWTGNAQDLIRNGTCDINSVIGCRDSIMTTLIHWGLPNKDSFDIMEKVRKGKGLAPEKEALMREHNVPDWYIGSCKKIKYMFPKAHAAAYTLSTLRVAWFKVYHPEEYYCSFFTIRGDEFNAGNMCKGEEHLANHRRELGEKMHQDDNPKTKSEFYLSEIVEEMYHRGIKFLPIDLEKSHATNFVKVAKGEIRPPLDAIDGISSSMAEAITEARDEAPFTTREDLMNRAHIGKAALEILDNYGLLTDLPETSQIDIFSLL
ncbi:MAG: PolC-type DNA polymerase III [Saccharofermentans sp.]|nr:PolC-type DNA polymerase III [Saccharofermentans sp.]